jgi:hypothetical protein
LSGRLPLQAAVTDVFALFFSLFVPYCSPSLLRCTLPFVSAFAITRNLRHWRTFSALGF